MKNLFLLVICAVFAFSCKETEKKDTLEPTTAAAESLPTPQEGATTAAVVPQPATDVPSYMNIELQGYKTPDINLKSVYGEVVFINFWGSWCPPCRREMPSIQSLYDKYQGKVKFATVAFEKRPGNHKAYIDKNGYTFPVYVAQTPIETKLKARGFPTTIILNKKGEIVAKDVGMADWNSPKVHELLDKLLAE